MLTFHRSGPPSSGMIIQPSGLFEKLSNVYSSLMAAIVSATESHPNYAVMLSSFGSGGVPYGKYLLASTTAGLDETANHKPAGLTNFPDGTVDSAIPVRTFAGQPPSGYTSGGEGFLGTYQGINTIIYAYGGAMLFFNLLAEMRNPWDFWKVLSHSRLRL